MFTLLVCSTLFYRAHTTTDDISLSVDDWVISLCRIHVSTAITDGSENATIEPVFNRVKTKNSLRLHAIRNLPWDLGVLNRGQNTTCLTQEMPCHSHYSPRNAQISFLDFTKALKLLQNYWWTSKPTLICPEICLATDDLGTIDNFKWLLPLHHG